MAVKGNIWEVEVVKERRGGFRLKLGENIWVDLMLRTCVKGVFFGMKSCFCGGGLRRK